MYQPAYCEGNRAPCGHNPVVEVKRAEVAEPQQVRENRQVLHRRIESRADDPALLRFRNAFTAHERPGRGRPARRAEQVDDQADGE